MNKLTIIKSKRFDHDVRLAKKRGLDLSLLWNVVEKLASCQQLEPKYRDHKLLGTKGNFRECHIRPNWLLIYRIEKGQLELYLFATGTHSDLF